MEHSRVSGLLKNKDWSNNQFDVYFGDFYGLQRTQPIGQTVRDFNQLGLFADIRIRTKIKFSLRHV